MVCPLIETSIDGRQIFVMISVPQFNNRRSFPERERKISPKNRLSTDTQHHGKLLAAKVYFRNGAKAVKERWDMLKELRWQT
jgi:hypothetical protein